MSSAEHASRATGATTGSAAGAGGAAHATTHAGATGPLTRAQVVDAYFMEHRARVLDVAAFLDRLDRAQPGAGEPLGDDFRVAAFRRAVALLGDGKPERTRRVLELLSDPSTEPIASAPTKGATGAFNASAPK